MSKTISVRLSRLKPNKYHNQLKHDRRDNKYIPKYIDKNRSGENVVIIDSKLAHITGYQYLEYLNKHRQHIFESGESGLKRKRLLTKNNNIAYSGIITFGTEAQKIVMADRERLKQLYENVVKRICQEYGTGCIQLIAHFDEQAPHAHFILRMMRKDGTLLNLKQKDMKRIQDIAGEVCREMGFDIARGKPKEERIRDGEPMHKYVHRSVRELHHVLPNAIEEREAEKNRLEEEIARLTTVKQNLVNEIRDLEEKRDKRIKDIEDKDRLIAKAQRQLNELEEKDKETRKRLEKRIATYERRKENYEKELNENIWKLEVKGTELVETENKIIENRAIVDQNKQLKQEQKSSVSAVRQFGENLGKIAAKLPDKQAAFLEKVIEKASANIEHPVMDVLLDAFYSDQARDIIR